MRLNVHATCGVSEQAFLWDMRDFTAASSAEVEAKNAMATQARRFMGIIVAATLRKGQQQKKLDVNVLNTALMTQLIPRFPPSTGCMHACKTMTR